MASPSIPGTPAPTQAPAQSPAPSSPLSVTSEIGRLRRVCLHRPGNELLNLMPADLGRLLFDDIPFLEVAQAEHDRYPQQAAPAPLFPDRVQDRRIKRNPGQPGRNDVQKSIPARSAVPVEGQQQLLVDIQKGLPNHRCGSF